MFPCARFLKKSYSLNQIELKRGEIYRRALNFLGDPNLVELMSDLDLRKLFNLYDELFFDGEISKYFSEIHEVHTELIVKFGNFGLSGQISDLGLRGELIDTEGISGHCKLEIGSDYCRHILLISRPILSNLFKEVQKLEADPETTNGLFCYTQLDCLMITLEHEIIHLIINIWCRSQNDTHGTNFMNLAYHIFGHEKPFHSLGSPTSAKHKTKRSYKSESFSVEYFSEDHFSGNC